jgi:hypothetical protein
VITDRVFRLKHSRNSFVRFTVSTKLAIGNRAVSVSVSPSPNAQ